MYHYRKYGVEKNMANAVEWYENIIVYFGGYEENMVLTLAQIYIYGNGVPQNGKRVLELLIEIALPNYSYIRRGRIYEDGQDTPLIDTDERAYYFSDSDSWESDVTKYTLTGMYFYGNAVEKDISKAIAWYERIIEYDYNDKTMYMLGECYSDENYSERNIYNAIEWYKKSAYEGHVKAMYRLAGIYLCDEDVEKNLSVKLSKNLSFEKYFLN